MIEKFGAYLAGGIISDQPSEGFDALPAVFRKAYELWKTAPRRNNKKAAALLKPYVNAAYYPVALREWAQLFVPPDGIDVDHWRLPAISYAIEYLEFDKGTAVPRIWLRAAFAVPVVPHFKTLDMEEWVSFTSDHGCLGDPVAIGWKIPTELNPQDLDYFIYEHSELFCVLLDEDEAGM